MHRGPTNLLRPISKIDTTVFVFVATIVLDIAFVVVALATSTHYGVSIDLPRVIRPKTTWRLDQHKGLIVTVMRDGKVFVGKEPIASDQLSAKLREHFTAGDESKPEIMADARTRYRAVEEVLDGMRSVGVGDIEIRVAEKRY